MENEADMKDANFHTSRNHGGLRYRQIICDGKGMIMRISVGKDG
jgi:hypothetical protein